ncbi:DUF4159 domain-containing protein [Aureliella helgolandensis]|uniref:DUF4159 domain-containing protein n=1 Tax=Aureliella helgolandensis TaxID=2527968 RepID=A0A518GC51_9BACT|nr:DUF4159 domain-containing protein [Aureliella helgolandensis]QDV26161.1 hypothetical protein Q31a_45330 [Aureliella helgolandensis]
MRRSIKLTLLTTIVVCMVGSSLFAWQWGRGGRRGRDPNDRGGVPVWDVSPRFKSDTFTFARVRYSDGSNRWGGRGGREGRWTIDMPDSDLNFSLRLQQITSLKVNPHPVVVDLDSPELFDYPFIYMIEPGNLYFSEPEVAGLRKYCLNGGFMMVDDFWGDHAYRVFYEQIKRVFPEREPQDVPLEHEIFQCVYPLTEKPQIPSIGGDWQYGITWEEGHGSDTRTPNYRAIYDDEGRIMVFICHNTDLGDGWEQEGVHEEYFREFSVKKSYPLGINIVTYAMTH